MKRRMERLAQWVDDGGGRWFFWTTLCLALAAWTLASGGWYDYVFGSLLLVEAAWWGFRVGPRMVDSKRRERESRQHTADAQARFYWTMGARGVPLDVVRQADELLHDGSIWQANSLLKEWV
jgi:hypothetical protein